MKQTSEKEVRLLNARSQIERSKLKGFKVIAENVTPIKEVIRIVCEGLKVNFFINDIEVADLKSMWNRTGLVRYITFYDWLLVDNLED